MSFNSYEFIFDGIPSSNYGLVISSINNSGVQDSPMGSSVNPITKKLLRNPKEYIFGVEQSPVLEFTLEITSQNPISADMRNFIGSWLFGQMTYKKLQILQDDLQNYYYNVLFTDVTLIYVGNLHYGYKIKVRSDSPFAYGNTFSITKNYSIPVNEFVNIMNTSTNNYYTYPYLTFTMNSYGNNIMFVNETETALGNNRPVIFTNLLANEEMTLDNERQIITASSGLKRIGNFNLNWLRLLPGLNVIYVSGQISTFTLSFSPTAKLGG